MKPQNLAMGALAGILVVPPMIAVMYLVDKWVNLSFPPFDVFDWIARILPGPVVTFGIDLMIDVLGVVGMSVADTAKTAEQVIAILMFLAGGVVATIVVFALVERWERLRAWPKLGYLIGAVVGSTHRAHHSQHRSVVGQSERDIRVDAAAVPDLGARPP